VLIDLFIALFQRHTSEPTTLTGISLGAIRGEETKRLPQQDVLVD
jgi:hypothetical protein